MLSVAVPSSFSGRGIFSGADIVNDNFGAGGPQEFSSSIQVEFLQVHAKESPLHFLISVVLPSLDLMLSYEMHASCFDKIARIQITGW